MILAQPANSQRHYNSETVGNEVKIKRAKGEFSQFAIATLGEENRRAKKEKYTYFAGLDRNRRRSFGLMEDKKREVGSVKHVVAQGHNREHQRVRQRKVPGFVEKAQGLPEVRLIARQRDWEKQMRSFQVLSQCSIRGLFSRTSKGGATVKCLSFGQVWLAMSDFMCGPGLVGHFRSKVCLTSGNATISMQ